MQLPASRRLHDKLGIPRVNPPRWQDRDFLTMLLLPFLKRIKTVRGMLATTAGQYPVIPKFDQPRKRRLGIGYRVKDPMHYQLEVRSGRTSGNYRS